MNNIIEETKTQALENSLKQAIKNLVETMYEFKESDFNKVPFEGSWTGAQVCSHSNKSLDFIDQIVNGESEPTRRDPEQHVPALRGMMEDMSSKGKSAPILFPDNHPIDRVSVRKLLTDSEQKLLHDIDSLELFSTCTAMEFPGIGYLTRYELINFAVSHTKRHTIQLQNIHQALLAPAKT